MSGHASKRLPLIDLLKVIASQLIVLHHLAFYGPMSEIPDEAFQKVMAVNIQSNLWLVNRVAPKMAERGRGSIVHTSSIYGATMGPDQRIYEGSEYLGRPINTPPVYSASKATLGSSQQSPSYLPGLRSSQAAQSSG